MTKMTQSAYLRINTGNLAIFAAIRRASSLLSSLAAVGKLLPGTVRHDEGGANVLDGRGRREAAVDHGINKAHRRARARLFGVACGVVVW